MEHRQHAAIGGGLTASRGIDDLVAKKSKWSCSDRRDRDLLRRGCELFVPDAQRRDQTA